VASAALPLLGLGCMSVSLGPAVGRNFDGPNTTLGGRASVRTYLLGNESLMVGADVEPLWVNSESPSSRGLLRAYGTIGWGNLPQKYGPPLGTEVLARIGYAQLPGPTGLAHSFAFGSAVAFPLRISRRHETWDSQALLGSVYMLVPEIGLTHMRPVGD